MSAAQRHAATQQHIVAIAAINELFDKVDELATARDRLTGIGPLGPQEDPIRDAETMLSSATQLNEALCQLRAVALTAAEHRNRNDLAADIGTKSVLLFPRPPRRPSEPASPCRNARDEADSLTSVAHDEIALALSQETP